MSNFSDFIPLIMENKLNQAKEVLNQRLYSKLGVVLENKLEAYAPTIFMNEEELAVYEEKKKLDYKDEDKDGDIDEDGDTDETDKYLKNRSEKIAANMNNEAEDKDGEELNEEQLFEEFVDELQSVVEEIEKELGDELTEEEIQEIAEELLSEKECGMSEDDYENDEEDEEEEDKSEEKESKKKKDKE